MEQVILAKSCQTVVGDGRGMHEAVVAARVDHEFVGASVPMQELKMRSSLDPGGEILPARRQFIEAFYLLDDLLVFIAWQKGPFGSRRMRLGQRCQLDARRQRRRATPPAARSC